MLSKIGFVLVMLAFFGPQTFAIVIDDFESGNLSNWTTRCGEWAVVSPGHNSNFALQTTGICCCGVAADKRIDYNFFIGSYGKYSFDVFIPSSTINNIGFSIQEAGNCNFLGLRLFSVERSNQSDAIYLVQGGGSAPALACTPGHLSVGVWHTVSVERYPNGVVRVYTDSTLEMEGFSLAPQYAGKVVLQAHSCGLMYDNITFDPNLPPDPPIPAPSTCGLEGPLQCDRDLGCGPVCPANGDINGDGSLTPPDIVLMLSCTFLGTPGCICPAP